MSALTNIGKLIFSAEELGFFSIYYSKFKPFKGLAIHPFKKHLLKMGKDL